MKENEKEKGKEREPEQEKEREESASDDGDEGQALGELNANAVRALCSVRTSSLCPRSQLCVSSSRAVP